MSLARGCSRDGFIGISEGWIFWKYTPAVTVPTDDCTRPVLLFIHAGVADHTLWDEQVSYFTSIGWNTLVYDLFGYGKSTPNRSYLESSPRPVIRHFEHPARLVEELLHHSIDGEGRKAASGHDSASMSQKLDSERQTCRRGHQKVVAVGLSRGGATAIDFTVTFPTYVSALVIVAGGLSGFQIPSDSREDALFEQQDSLMAVGDLNGVVDLTVQLWADGPLQASGRCRQDVRAKIRRWGEDISARERDQIGGWSIRSTAPDPPAAGRLEEIKVPLAVGLGKFDESSTTAAMRYLHGQVKGSALTEFETAHMVNMEAIYEFNAWIGQWLEQEFL